jgi:hypothetical protein
MKTGTEKTSIREGREALAKGAKKTQIWIESFRVLRASFAPFAYGCPLAFGDAS